MNFDHPGDRAPHLRIVVHHEATCVADVICGGWHGRKVTRPGAPLQPTCDSACRVRPRAVTLLAPAPSGADDPNPASRPRAPVRHPRGARGPGSRAAVGGGDDADLPDLDLRAAGAGEAPGVRVRPD